MPGFFSRVVRPLPQLPTQTRRPLTDPTGKKVDRGKPYAERKLQLLIDNLWISTLGLALVWAFGSYEASLSYGLGAMLGFGYITLLGRFVEAMGTSGPGEWRARSVRHYCSRI